MSQSTCGEAELSVRRALAAWFDTPLGLSLQALEAHRLRSVLPQLYGSVALQLGYIGRMDLLDATIAPTRAILDVQGDVKGVAVRGEAEALPLDARSVDLALLPHTLDFSQDPHEVLREVHRVLAPEGHAVILGFNPLSLWGLWRLFHWRRDAVPWCAGFIRLLRLKDWLALLGFELTHGSMLYYRPPVQHEDVMHRLYFLENIGDRWWPLGAAVYLVVARKRVFGMTPIKPYWRKRRLLGSRATQPVAHRGG